MANLHDYTKLQAEIDAMPYGSIPTRTLSPQMQRYICDRYEAGRKELAGVKPGRMLGSNHVANGYTRLLGVWRFYAGKRGLDSAIHPDNVWAATLKNNQMVELS